MSDSGGCNARAMALVALQLAAVLAGQALVRRRPGLLHRAASWRGLLASLLLMLLGVGGLSAAAGAGGGRCEPLAWLCFTAGGVLLSLQLANYDTGALRRGLLQAGALLLLAAAAAPLLGYYASAARTALPLLTLALLVSLATSVLWPCAAAAQALLSAAGAALFAVWTVHDIAARPCGSPWLKSVEIFLDLFNLLTFSSNAP
jgi:hypothetical protein